MRKKINTKEIVNKIEKLAKSRIAAGEVVSLDSFRDVNKKLNSKIILLIEDDLTMKLSIERILKNENYIVRSASDATELGMVLDNTSVDLILMDIGLPWINGLELAVLLKESNELKAIPLVFISASESELDQQKAKSIGADLFIHKPFEIATLVQGIKSLIG